MIDQQALAAAAAAAGLTLPEAAASQLDRYADLLVEWNEKINLTAITDPDGILRRHFLDCLLPLPALALPQGAAVIDVGTGAGFPGLPLCFARPDLRLTLLDSLAKRLRVLEEIVRETGVQDRVTLVHARAEEAGRGPMREQFDAAVSRAVAPLARLAEYCLPFVRPGGALFAYKGPAAGEELAEAARAIRLLGGEAADCLPYAIPGTDLRHTVVVLRKVSPTPAAYPRQSAKIQQKPL